jgi:hypothetical protein
MSRITPHSLGVHKVLRHFDGVVRPLLNVLPNRRLEAAVNIADLRACAKKVGWISCTLYLNPQLC